MGNGRTKKGKLIGIRIKRFVIVVLVNMSNVSFGKLRVVQNVVGYIAVGIFWSGFIEFYGVWHTPELERKMVLEFGVIMQSSVGRYNCGNGVSIGGNL